LTIRPDLHTHSTFSDGLLSPTELIHRAQTAGLNLLALTDHDTTQGVPEIIQAATDLPIRIIPGIELSTRWKKYDIHILGLNIQLDHPAINQVIEQQNELRMARARAIGCELHALGIEQAYEKACGIAGHNRVGRPHYAQLLIQEGLVSDMNQAFKRYLKRGQCAYVPTQWISPEDAISAIVAAGGIATLAHPLKYSLTQTKLRTLLQLFKESGGEGIEVVSGEMEMTQMQALVKLAQHFDLLASTGSDFHDPRARVSMGKQRTLPKECRPIWERWL
jgi:predicted metal-dependent phosphoesterase TrpH